MIELSKYTSYALFRMPFADEVHVVCQHPEQSSVSVDLEHMEEVSRAFVMIPFDEKSCPIVCVRPDVETVVKMEMLAEERAGCIGRGQSDVEAYTEAFSRFHAAVPSRFPKLVLSRSVCAEYGGNPLDAFVRACYAYPRTMVYLCYTEETGFWIGSTPEILVAGAKSHYRTVALAGTMTQEGEWSEKNKTEQSIVADYVRKVITPLSRVVEEAGPYTSRAGNLYHLKTEFHFTPLPAVTVYDFIRQLHPTPAVCGLPKREAHAYIVANEGHDRQYYAGVVGMLDVHGETNLYVNLRCCKLQKEGDGTYQCTLYAGGGILPESTVESELQETEEKLKTICLALSPTYSN